MSFSDTITSYRKTAAALKLSSVTFSGDYRMKKVGRPLQGQGKSRGAT